MATTSSFAADLSKKPDAPAASASSLMASSVMALITMTFTRGLLLRDLAADIQPTDVRQVQVHHDHDRLKPRCGVGDLAAVGDDANHVALGREQAAERLHDAWMIVDEQDAGASRHYEPARSPAPRDA